jgi:hypothetical protein
LYWTNTAGSRVTVATNTGAGSWANATTKVVDDIPLWSDRNGQPVWEPNTNSNNYVQSGATLAVTMVGGSGANTASTWVFTPVYDGVNEATAAAELWTIAFTPTTTTVATLVTNVPTYRWPGAKLLRLVRVVPGDTDASSQVTLLDVNVNGFVPVP